MSDAWVLFAVALADRGRGATLREVIAAGGFIDRAIVTADELRRALANLLHAGYVREQDKRFALSGDAAELRPPPAKSADGAARLLERVRWFLATPVYRELVQDAPDEYPGVTDEDIEAAYEQHKRVASG